MRKYPLTRSAKWLAGIGVILLLLLIALLFWLNRSASCDKPYDYPYPLGSEQWHTLSKGEVDNACRIPDEVLEKLTTKALVQTLSERPDIGTELLVSGYLYFTPDRCDAYLDDLYYSGIRTLMERKDATKELLDWYEQMPYPETEKETAWDALFGRGINMELLIACDWYLNYDNGYLPESRERLLQLIEKRHAVQPLELCSPIYVIYHEDLMGENITP